jgi:hypothetical protein
MTKLSQHGDFSETSRSALEGLELRFAEQMARVEDALDFAACQLPNGKVYGIADGKKCRKGTPITLEPGEGMPVLFKKATAAGLKGSEVKAIADEVRAEFGVKQIKQGAELQAALNKIINRIEGTTQGPKTEAAPEPSAKPASAKPKAKAKKEAVSPEDAAEAKARAKYDKAAAKIQDIEARHKEIKKQVEDETGQKVFATGQGRKIFDGRVKAAGLPSETKLFDLRQKLRDLETPKMKAEREGKAEAERQGGLAARKADKAATKAEILKRLERQEGRFKGDLNAIDRDIKTWTDLIRRNKDFQTADNLNDLVALRLLRARVYASKAGERKAYQESQVQIAKTAPKYNSTPGSRTPIKKEAPEETAKRLKKYEDELEKRMEERRKKDPNDQSIHSLAQELYTTRQARGLLQEGVSVAPPLSDIYRRQGFDARPELVTRRSDLEKRNDIIKQDDGSPMILYRGVTTEGFANQFKGGGDDGNVHFAGKGIYGNGTYAATAQPDRVDLTKGQAISTAKGYSGSNDNAERRVTAFALRSDANVVDFRGGTPQSRMDDYGKWQKEVVAEAKAKTGIKFSDVGEAAAALGIHAYRVPQYQEDYWVILNRGAIVAALNPEL